MLVHEERAIRQNERRRVLGAIRLHSDLGDIADLQRLLVELRSEARDKRDQRRLALLCGVLLNVLEADDEPGIEPEVSQIDRWLVPTGSGKRDRFGELSDSDNPPTEPTSPRRAAVAAHGRDRVALRPCLEAGCPNLTTSARCHRHTRAKDKARGTRQQRGYDRTHELERERWKPTVEAGLAYCSRCDQQIRPGEAWALDHSDDRRTWLGPSHAGCNASAAGAHRTGGRG